MVRRPRETPDPDAALSEWLTFVVDGKCSAVLSRLDKNNLFEMEGIHKLRVAVRRLDAVIREFREHLPGKKGIKLRDEMRRLMKLLGKVREYDVFLSLLKRRSAKMRGEAKIIINILLAKKSRQRRNAAERLREYLHMLDRRELKRSFREISRFAAKRGGARAAAGTKAASFKKTMRRVIPRRLESFLANEKNIIDHPERLEEFHDMRLAGKPLRYMLEIALPVFGNDAKQCLREVESALDEMGTIHDYDVAIESVSAYVEELTGYDDTLNAPMRSIAALVKGLRAQREEQFHDLCARFNRWNREGFHARLISAIT